MKNQKTLCLKCGKRGEALVCSSQSCPIVVHESCMPCAVHFDYTGCFYCPYCLLKLSLAECHQAREKALLARRALVSFLGSRTLNNAGHLNSSHNLKRKTPEAPTIVKERNNAICVKVYQPVQFEHQNDSQFHETLSGNKQQAGPPEGHCLGKWSITKDNGEKKLRNDVHTREDTVIVSQTQKSTNDNKKTTKKVKNSLKGVEREQTQTDFLETSCFANSLKANEILYKGNAFQDNCFIRTQVVENFDRSAENREGYSGGTDEGSRKDKTSVHSKTKYSESLPCGESAILSCKYPVIEQTVASYNGVAEKLQTPEGPQETSFFYAKQVNASMIGDKLYEIIEAAYQNDYTLTRQVAVDSGNMKNCSLVVENLNDDERNIIKSPIQDAYTSREDNESVKHKKAGNLINKNEEISKPMDQCYNGQAEEEREESRDVNACLVKENTRPMYEQMNEVFDGESREDCFPQSERVENPGNDDPPAEIGSNCNRSADEITTQGNALRDPVHHTVGEDASVTHELGNLTRKQPETTKKLEGNHTEVAEIEQTQAELQSYRDVDKQEMVEEYDAEKCRSYQDECFLKCEGRGEKDADQNACTGEDCFGRTGERQTRPRLVKNSPQDTENGSVSVSFGECGSVDDTESCNSEYLPHMINAGKNRQLKKNLKNDVQHGESSRCSENTIEETEEHKRKSVKQIQRSATLSSARRRKLPWTVEEVEILKEGVQLCSMKTNKNLPWMKVLEFGCHVFDGTRTPADLKDKWKNMKNKGNV